MANINGFNRFENERPRAAAGFDSLGDTGLPLVG